jgi:deoxyribodipyrimidine photo-lyase
MNLLRVHVLRSSRPSLGPILYWMHRDFRAMDNWGLIHARQQALSSGQPLAVVFCLSPAFAEATRVHFDFLLQGLQETARTLKQDGIPFFALQGNPGAEVARFARDHKAALVVTDFDPLRIKTVWIHDLLQACDQPVHEVDSRNIVPARIASSKREFMARTIRPKIKRLLPEFLDEFPVFASHPHPWPTACPPPDFLTLKAALRSGARPQTLSVEPGERSARVILDKFLHDKLPRYMHRNDPNQDVCSGLSAHLHFGMISSQRVALETLVHGSPGEQADAFLEELIVRREIADNYCLHTPDYDSVSGFPAWAQETLHKHRRDPRPAVYSPEEFENAKTHEPLWNAAQTQMLRTGKMHGYLRMYWAKKILEWSPSAADALRTAMVLNDRYSLDGRDSNGYTGIAWSIGGVHDRGWTERPVFGKIRYMNLAGARRKFDVDRFVRSWIAPRDDEST